ncbi:hypothetical protein GIX45_17755 [Erwinia sp. CPCC 100877]|nr:hypothetical protein [Erwinia sp. CPCC 100877]
MKITQGPLILLNVISPKHIQPKYEIKNMLQYSQHFDFQDDFYQIGPDVLSITRLEGEPNFVEYEFFLSLNLPPKVPEGLETLRTFDKYVVENALITRIADNEENYFDYDLQLRLYAEENFDLDLSVKIYFVVTDNREKKSAFKLELLVP